LYMIMHLLLTVGTLSMLILAKKARRVEPVYKGYFYLSFIMVM
jgi:hypothetical protein